LLFVFKTKHFRSYSSVRQHNMYKYIKHFLPEVLYNMYIISCFQSAHCCDVRVESRRWHGINFSVHKNWENKNYREIKDWASIFYINIITPFSFAMIDKYFEHLYLLNVISSNRKWSVSRSEEATPSTDFTSGSITSIRLSFVR